MARAIPLTKRIGRGRAIGLIIGHVRCTRQGQKLGKRCLVSTHVRPAIATSRACCGVFRIHERFLETERCTRQDARVPYRNGDNYLGLLASEGKG